VVQDLAGVVTDRAHHVEVGFIVYAFVAHQIVVVRQRDDGSGLPGEPRGCVRPRRRPALTHQRQIRSRPRDALVQGADAGVVCVAGPEDRGDSQVAPIKVGLGLAVAFPQT